MEDEKCLERVKDPAMSQVIWRLAVPMSASTPRTPNGWITKSPAELKYKKCTNG
jgi:hypothetical protein